MSFVGYAGIADYDRVKLARNGCNRCDSKTVSWRESKAGNWYLIEAFDFDGEWRANYKDFHSAYCASPELHEVKQRQINSDLGIAEKEEEEFYSRDDLMIQREEHTAAENSKRFLALHDMCKKHPAQARGLIVTYEHTLATHSMDDGSRRHLQAEIAFMHAALGDTEGEE